MAGGNFGGGNGSSESPYLVEDAHDLDAVRNYLGNTSVYFKQVTDIDLGNWGNWLPIQNGTSTSYSDSFRGTYDGGGYKISNMTCEHNRNYVGLFGYAVEAKFLNIGLENVSIVDGNYTGGLVGSASSSTISNCYATGDVTGGSNVGGLVGQASSLTISNCYAAGDVTGGDYTGGLIGVASPLTISNCYATGNVTGGSNVGGLVGYAHFSKTISNCYATGDVTGDSYVGGLFGRTSSSTVSNCYATGDVAGYRYVSGLVGDATSTVISNCYATGNVTGGRDVGGLVGYTYSSTTISNCYALNERINRVENSTSTTFYRVCPSSAQVNCFARSDMGFIQL